MSSAWNVETLPRCDPCNVEECHQDAWLTSSIGEDLTHFLFHGPAWEAKLP